MTSWLAPIRPEATVLFLGAHADDIEIGCGGTILELLGKVPDLRIVWIVCSGSDLRRQEATESAQAFCRGARRLDIQVHNFRDGFFPYEGAPIKEMFEALKGLGPDLIFTHHRDDRHQDHRVISDLTWNTFRSAPILEYEIPKYDGDLGHPNCFVEITPENLQEKSRLLELSFPSQLSKRWFTEDTFTGLARIRGIESAAVTGFAEGFYGRKLTVDFLSSSARS